MSETSTTVRRPGGRSARVRAAVLDAALNVLADGGYEAFSVDAVAERAGVHKTTIYRRWPTKADLVLDALHARSDAVIALPNSGDLRADLVRFLRTVAANVSSPVGRGLIAATLHSGPGPDAEGAIRRRFWDERFDRVRGRLRDEVADGHLATDTDVDLLIESLVSPVFFRALVSGAPINNSFLDTLVRRVLAGNGAS